MTNGNSYTVIVHGVNTCQQASATVTMSNATGISPNAISMAGLSLHPNPTSEVAILEVDKTLISSYGLANW
jgi:hypothetical protein